MCPRAWRPVGEFPCPPAGCVGNGRLVGRCGNLAQANVQLIAADETGIKEPWDAFWGQRYAQVRDPDGNPVDLYAPLES